MISNHIFQTSFEDLPTEIFLEIFAFLPLRELVKAFSGLNSYIDLIIESMTDIKHVVTYNDVNAIILLQLRPTQIGHLVIVHAEKVDFTSLINLRSLKLNFGTCAQFDSIRPKYFPILEILHIYDMLCSSSKDNSRPIIDLLEVILSNGFPQLRVCTAIRIGTLSFSKRWKGSPSLHSLCLGMKTEHDQEQLRSACPNLRRFVNGRRSSIDLPKGDEEWKTTTSLMTLIEATIRIIDNPSDNHYFIHPERAVEYRNNRQTYYKKALNSMLIYGRPRY
ncbi:unnamed protein product [Rotaria sordida]|uniref:F-box domain-containing protein n=1 Tax=Rotaria sordida TaxID=392033 RepID=A0A819PW72_9BILA|nr:unnamed protein product [Rotaria sordida]